MQFEPINEEAYAMRNVWPKGWYSCTVVDSDDAVQERISQAKGTQYFRTLINVYNANGGFKQITANIIASGAAAWQLRSAAEAFGLLEKYRAGELDPQDLRGRSAFVRLGVEEDKNGVYAPKNIISDYRDKLPKSAEKAASALAQAQTQNVSSGEHDGFEDFDMPL